MAPYCGGGNSESEGTPKSELEKDIARELLTFQIYSDEMLWSLKKYLFEKIKFDESLLYNDSAFITFYDSMLNTPVNGFIDVKGHLKEFYNIDSIYKVTIKAKQQLLDANSELIKSYEAQLNNSALTDQQKQSIINSIIGIQSAIKTIKNFLNTLYAQYKSGRLVVANSAAAINQGIGTTETIESNLKAVNEIYLSTYAHGNHSFTSAQISALNQIRQQCPAAGGEGVFKARSLYYMVDKNARYDDRQTCLNQGILYRQRNSNEEACHLYPNPTTGVVTFTYFLPDNVNATLFITDNIGRVVMKYDLKFETNNLHFNVAHLQPGIYNLMMMAEDGSSYKDKLILIH